MTTMQRPTAVCVFESRAQAERAIDELHRAGFRDDQIGFAMRGEDGRPAEAPSGSHAGEAAATGALAGAGVGGVLGAIATGLIPGIGPVIAGGLLAGIVGGAAIGAGAGGLVGWLAGEGIPEDEARYYESEFKAGRAVVTVRAEGRYADAAAILTRYGDCQAPAAATATTEQRRETATGETMRVPVREEQLTAERRTVQSGEVEVRKEVREEQQHFTVPVEREEVSIERHAVNRPADSPVGEGETIRVPLREEQVEVTKRPVVREEVEIRKGVVQEQQPVSGTVRREEVHVDQDTWRDAMPRFREDWQSRYGQTGATWTEYEPAYRYGYEMGQDSRFQGRDWSTVEPELRRNYGTWARSHNYQVQESGWERFKDAIRYGWENARPAAGVRQ